MRILSYFVLMAGMVFVLASPQQSAASTIDLKQIGGTGVCTAGGGTGGEDVCVGGVGDTLGFAITMVIDGAGTNAWHIDLAWDQSLENALNLTSVAPSTNYVRGFANPTPPPTTIGYTALGVVSQQESDGSQEGNVYGVTGAITQDFNLTIANTSFRAGVATFQIGGANQTAVNLGFFRTDGASMGNSASQFITPTFGSWVINQTPEPGTSLLMGMGLLGLALAGRRSRS
ncbi:MAG: PEP-CTERM sorting domain-containing protein [Myxococcota bacterium]